MIILTDHFRERWRERVGGPVPAAGDVERMIRGAVVLQKFRRAYTPRGRGITILAIYWIPELAAVIKMDDKRRQAVTVITADLSGEKEGAMCSKQKALFFRCPDCGRRGKGGELLPPGDGDLRCPECGGHRWRWENKNRR